MQTRKKSTAKDPAAGQEAALLAALAQDLAECSAVLGRFHKRFGEHRKGLEAIEPTAPVVATLKSRSSSQTFTAAGWAAALMHELSESLIDVIDRIDTMPTDFAADARRHVEGERRKEAERQKRKAWRARAAEVMLLASQLSVESGNEPDPLLTRSPWPYHRRALEQLASVDRSYRPDLKEFAALEKQRDAEVAAWNGRGTPPHMTIYFSHFDRFDYLDTQLRQLRVELEEWARG
jgi:hypothetical protein